MTKHIGSQYNVGCTYCSLGEGGHPASPGKRRPEIKKDTRKVHPRLHRRSGRGFGHLSTGMAANRHYWVLISLSQSRLAPAEVRRRQNHQKQIPDQRHTTGRFLVRVLQRERFLHRPEHRRSKTPARRLSQRQKRRIDLRPSLSPSPLATKA